MHIYFSGIGGAGIGPLALVAKQAGYEVSGSDKQDSSYISYLREQGVDQIHVGQDITQIAEAHKTNPIDWFVYSSALSMENPNHPELLFCKEHDIRSSKRDELLTKILEDKNLELIAIAGTHGKTTTTAMTIWLLKQLGLPISYLLPAKTSFASMGAYDPESKYFIYEADEYDRNFLAYSPILSLITGIDWDHPDIYPTREEYNEAFRQFVSQSKTTYLWRQDAEAAGIMDSASVHVLDFEEHESITLPGIVNRQDGELVVQGIDMLLPGTEKSVLVDIINRFPGVSRRFEQLSAGLYTDYAHTPPKISGAIQLGREVAGNNLVVVYEGLHNTRQHFIKDELFNLFEGVKALYIVPSYLAREDESLEMFTPDKLKSLLNPAIQRVTTASALDESLQKEITEHIEKGDTVLCLSAGGGNSLDEWLRSTFTDKK